MKVIAVEHSLRAFGERPELLRAFRAGDRAALEEVYFAHVDAVAQVVQRGARLTAQAAVSGAPRDDWADLVQETFSRAFSERARLAYDGLRPYRQYLLTICRNLLADWMRRRGRELPADFSVDTVEPAAPVADEGIAPAELAVVERYVAGLDARLAGVYRERYVSGRSQEEAARALGLSRQKVRTLEDKLRRGLEKELRRANLAG